MTLNTPRLQPYTLAPLAVLAFCLFMISVSRGMGETYGVFLLPLTESFEWSRASVTSIFSVYMISFGFGSLISGLVFDRLGPRFNYIIGLSLLAGCYGFAGHLESIISFYLVLGVCGGVGAAMVGIVPTQSLDFALVYPQTLYGTLHCLFRPGNRRDDTGASGANGHRSIRLARCVYVRKLWVHRYSLPSFVSPLG